MEVIRKYFDEKATIIQKFWRGYKDRKEREAKNITNARLFVNLQNVIPPK